MCSGQIPSGLHGACVCGVFGRPGAADDPLSAPNRLLITVLTMCRRKNPKMPATAPSVRCVPGRLCCAPFPHSPFPFLPLRNVQNQETHQFSDESSRVRCLLSRLSRLSLFLFLSLSSFGREFFVPRFTFACACVCMWQQRHVHDLPHSAAKVSNRASEQDADG